MALALLTAPPASASGNGLPKGYDIQRLDAPSPGATGQYPLGIAAAGDLNGDGKEDFLTSQLVNTRNDAGQISASGNGALYVISGATGERIKTIEAPDPGNLVSGVNNAANFAFPWMSRIGTNKTAAPFTDLASCPSPPPNAGELCRSATIGPADGVPDIIVGARGVDPRGVVDAGRVYVYDGATFALLKRIDQPPADTTPLAISRAGGSWFGRVALNPAGLPPCAGNGGIGVCDSVSAAVASGDVDAKGRPDIVVSASAHTEDWSTAAPGSQCSLSIGARCEAAGRIYVYHGEDIVGSSPGEILDGVVPTGGTMESIVTIKHPNAQADNTNPVNADGEQIGNYMWPIGDVGACKPVTGANPVPVPPPGGICARANGSTTQDGKPDFVAGVAAQDLPLDNPDPNYADAGTAYLIDGDTATILATYRNPEPQLGARFGSTDVTYPAGDLGDTTLPDILVGAPAAISAGVQSAGAAYAFSGNFKTGPGNFMFSRLQDPSPLNSEDFGGGYTGVGDLVPGQAAPANEVLVGGPGGFFGGASKPTILNDITFFNVATGKPLQTIRDPDLSAASQFGGKVLPLGDLNNDGFLDFAASSQLYDSTTYTDQGRVYIFRSNDTSPPPAEVAPPPPPPPPPAAVTPPPPPPPPAAASLLSGRCANDLRGTTDADSLIGTTAGDTIFALDGDDVVEALAGLDCVDAGADDDNVTGGAGNDSLLGGTGNDDLDGGSGVDRLFGQGGKDTLNGRSGSDMLAGGDGNDTINGGSGADRLFGERGNDRLTAGDSGGSTLDGGTGNDRIDAVNGRRDTVRCGAGLDTLVADPRDQVTGCERITRKRV
jgi:Ca2+-binding RTX toxin-like protein